MLKLHLLTPWMVSLVLGLLTREREEPMPSSEPPLVDTPLRWKEFYRELSRARRHERVFSIARFPLDNDGADGREADADGGVTHMALESLRHAIRLTDDAWVDGDSAFILMPETGRDQAVAAVSRVAGGLETESVTVATFPEDGVTSGALLAVLLRTDEASADVTAIAGRSLGRAEPVTATNAMTDREAG